MYLKDWHFFYQVGGGFTETVTKGVQFFPAVPRRSRHSSHHFVCTDDTTVSWSEEILFNYVVRGGGVQETFRGLQLYDLERVIRTLM